MDTSADGVPADPGMALKMSPPGLDSLAQLHRGEPIDEAALGPVIDFVEARLDCADFRAATLIKLCLAYPELISEPTRARMMTALLGFKYWMDEPGHDGMCFWSENHQVLFGAVEYLAGQLWPAERFTNAGLTGAEHRAKARARLERWFDHRFRFGFSEWCSNTYYEEDVAALSLLVDHADDPRLAARARVTLDLIMLDLAMHNFRGRFAATSGRCYEDQKKHPERADVNDIMHLAFGFEPGRVINYARMSGLFAVSGYRVPEVINSIAHDESTMIIRAAQGLDLAEVADHFADADDVETTGAQLWAMEAFTNPESIRVTMKALAHYDMFTNTFLSPLAAFARVPRALLPALVRTLNPATQGVALQRARIQTFRSRWGMLSSAQRHHPRTFGDQQHLWQATLPGDVAVFATHPGGAMFDETARNFSPSAWVGNGRLPDVAQDGPVLVAHYDTTGRRGYLEPPRQRRSHLYWPADRFDETRRGADWLAGRVGESLIGVKTSVAARDGETSEIVCAGVVTGYAVVLSDTGQQSLDALAGELAGSVLRADRHGVRWHAQRGEYELIAGGAFTVDGRPVEPGEDRLHADFARVPRFPDRQEIEHGGHRLLLTREGR